MVIVDALFFLVFALALGYTLVRVWRRKNGRNTRDRIKGFRPRIGFTRLDGMASLSLLLENESNTHVWAEEIEIFLSNLRAEQQASEASGHGVQKIRQMVHSDDMVPISLCEAIYKAAGNPQRKYSCAISSVLRYRIGEEWLEKSLETYRIRMVGLTVSGIHRERKAAPSLQTQPESQDVPAIAVKLK